MAIRGYSSGTQDTSSVPVVDVTTELNQGDMLYFDKEFNVFRGGPGISVPTLLSQLTNDAGLVTDEELTAALAGMASGGQIDLSDYPNRSYVDGLFANVGSSNFSGNYNDLTNKPVIPTAFSGNYNDLTNKPVIPQQQDLSEYVTSSQLNSAILNIDQFSGNYDDLTNQPSIPSIDGLSSIAYVDSQISALNTSITNSGSQVDLTPYSTTAQINSLISSAIAAQNLFNGDYNSLINKPAIPDVSQFLTETEIDTKIASATLGGSVDLDTYVTDIELQSALSTYQPSIDLSGYITSAQLTNEINNIPPTDLSNYVTSSALNTQLLNLAFFSGNYNDLTNQPSIPSIDGLSSIAYVDSHVSALNTSIANIAAGNTGGSGNVDLSGYATETYVQQQLSSATLGAVANIDDLNDVAIDGTETATHALMYNSLSEMWENVDLTENWATKDYVTDQLLGFSTDGTIDLEGYASENWVTQKLVERGHHFSGDYNDLVNRPTLFSGDYNDLYNTPDDQISSITFSLSGNTLQLSNGSEVDLGLLALDYSSFTGTPDLFSGDYNDLHNLPNLFSGNYLDLANKPYIPSIAGLATEDYVNNRWAEPDITGDRNFTHDVEFRSEIKQVASTATTSAQKRDLVFALETTNAIEMEGSFSDGSFITIADNTTAKFTATYVATSGSQHSSFTINGVVHKMEGILVAIGNNNYQITHDSGLGWTGTVSVDTVNNRLKFTVQGSDNITVDWVIFVELTEVTR